MWGQLTPGTHNLLETPEPGGGRGASGPWSGSQDRRFCLISSGPASWFGHWNPELRSSSSGEECCDRLVMCAMGREWTVAVCLPCTCPPQASERCDFRGGGLFPQYAWSDISIEDSIWIVCPCCYLVHKAGSHPLPCLIHITTL